MSNNLYCSNKNCSLPNSQILNKLHQETKKTWKQLANIYGVGERTIRLHANPSKKERKKVKLKRGRKLEFDGSDLELLRLYAITANSISQKFLANFFECSQATICRALKKAGVTYKDFTYQATEQLRRENQEKIEHFINVILPDFLRSDANIFFLDECSFHLNLAPRRGYEMIGKRLVGQKSGNKGKNQTLIFLTQITNGEKIIHSKIIEGGLNSEKFHQFLTEFNPPNNGKRNILIMDNLRVHKATDSCRKLKLSTIEELLKSKGVEIVFLPSYTPELNPVERIFNIIRQYVEKKQARKIDKLELAIEEKIKFFQGEDLNKYLASSVRECLMKNEKLGISYNIS